MIRAISFALVGTAAALISIAGVSVAHAHQGHSMQEPWHACEEAELGADCSWTSTQDAVYRGTCRQVAEQLLCVRNRPIVHATEHHHGAGSGHVHHEDHELREDPDRREAAERPGWPGVAFGGVGLLGLGLLGLRRRRTRLASGVPLGVLAALLVTQAGCKGSTTGGKAEAVPDPSVAGPEVEPVAGLDPAAFAEGALTTPIETVDCTLSNGDASSCYRMALKTAPSDHDAGPFCPRTIKDGPDVAGTWIHDGKVLDLDGAFIVGLAELYQDPHWKLYDEATGKVRYTATKEACAAAARPDVDEAYQNHCVECSVDHLDPDLGDTMLIPKRPVPRTDPGQLDRRGSVGVALNGVRFEAPAPLHAILSAYTIAAFDDCGGHVNLHAGYHYHGAKGCSKSVAQDDAHAELIGYAADGYPIHAMSNGDGREPDDLDVCRGHSDAARGYHYHAASPGENMFIGCLHGETARGDRPDDGARPGAGPPGGRPRGGAAGGSSPS